jgi:AraC-like DNA-binding protein
MSCLEMDLRIAAAERLEECMDVPLSDRRAPNARLILLHDYLRRRCRPTRLKPAPRYRASVRSLAEEFGVSERHMRRLINALEASGQIEIVPAGGTPKTGLPALQLRREGKNR